MPSFGAKLKQQREQRGVTLEEISQSTKIGSRFLRALEDDRFDQLPGGIFNKGFVRAYARSVGLDEDETVAGYLEATGATPEKPDTPLPLPEVRAQAVGARPGDLPWGVLAIALLIAALALVLWGFHNHPATTKTQPAMAPAPRSNLPTPQAAPAFGSPVSKSVTAETTRPRASAPLPPASSQPLSAKSIPASPQLINLQIKAREDSWVSIAADGKQIMRGTMAAASERSVHAAREIVVKAGNAGAVDFEFNGAKLPAQGNNGEVKTLIFDAAGFHPAPSPPVPQEENAPPQ